MRLVHLTPSTTAEVTGGLEHHVAYLAAALEGRGHEVIVVNTAESAGAHRHLHLPNGRAVLPNFLRHEIDVAAETIWMLGRRLLGGGQAARLAARVDALQPDVVHQHGYIDGLSASRLIARKYPVVFTNHTGAYLHLDRFAPTRLLQRQLMKRFTMVIGPSQELLPRTLNSHYVPNGADVEQFRPLLPTEREALKAKHHCAGKKVFLCPRRWAPTKGIIHLAKALQKLSASVKAEAVFLFAGNDTPGYARYQRNVRLALAASRCDVRILGNVLHPELAELMNISEACVIPSLMEATSLACLEAMACGTPVIGTRTGGLVELIEPGRNGWLVPLRDSNALAAALERVVALPAESLAQMSAEALSTVNERYTWRAVSEQTERVYEAALEKWRAHASPKDMSHARDNL